VSGRDCPFFDVRSHPRLWRAIERISGSGRCTRRNPPILPAVPPRRVDSISQALNWISRPRSRPLLIAI
jgi:hypothetical protein